MIKCAGKGVESLRQPSVVEQEAVSTFSPDQARSLRGIFDFLNDKDRDILYLIFVSKKKQMDVKAILHRTQSSLAYDIKRIRRRLQFIHYLHSIFDIFLDFIRRERERDNFTPDEIEILTLMLFTSSFTLTAQIMGISQVRVRHSFQKSLRKVEELAEECLKVEDTEGASGWFSIYEIFTIIRENLNVIRRLYRGSQS